MSASKPAASRSAACQGRLAAARRWSTTWLPASLAGRLARLQGLSRSAGTTWRAPARGTT
eukprot:9742265-Alexandrium_andersonii.AAC.1